MKTEYRGILIRRPPASLQGWWQERVKVHWNYHADCWSIAVNGKVNGYATHHIQLSDVRFHVDRSKHNRIRTNGVRQVAAWVTGIVERWAAEEPSVSWPSWKSVNYDPFGRPMWWTTGYEERSQTTGAKRVWLCSRDNKPHCIAEQYAQRSLDLFSDPKQGMQEDRWFGPVNPQTRPWTLEQAQEEIAAALARSSVIDPSAQAQTGSK